MKQSKMLPPLVFGLVLVASCAGLSQITHPVPPVTYEEVIRLTQEKVGPMSLLGRSMIPVQSFASIRMR
jgi:hypothetical protein